jgi:hypothetical protein
MECASSVIMACGLLSLAKIEHELNLVNTSVMWLVDTDHCTSAPMRMQAASISLASDC